MRGTPISSELHPLWRQTQDESNPKSYRDSCHRNRPEQVPTRWHWEKLKQEEAAAMTWQEARKEKGE